MKTQFCVKPIHIYYSLIGLYVMYLCIIGLLSFKIGPIYSFTNKSNSMSPTIDTGSIIFVKKYEEYNPGDMISFYEQNNKEEIITHRIVRLGGNVYVTKGDANEAIDQHIVVPRLIIGKVFFIVPSAGYLVAFAKSALGLWLTIIIPTSIIIALELRTIFQELQKRNETDEIKDFAETR